MQFPCQIANYFHHLLFSRDSVISSVEMYVRWCRTLATVNEIDTIAVTCHQKIVMLIFSGHFQYQDILTAYLVTYRIITNGQCRCDVMENTGRIACGPEELRVQWKERPAHGKQGQTQTREAGAVRPLLQVFRAGELLYLEFLPFASPRSALSSSSSCLVPAKPTFQNPLGFPGLWLLVERSQ